jgi:hypothetical protein
VGQAPLLPATGAATFTGGVKGSATITATPGSPAKTALALAKGTTLPKGLSFKDNGNNTATISGTPATNTGGSYSFGITASNAAGLMATETFTLLIDQAPAITSAGRATFVTGQADSFTVTTRGLPAATVAVNLSSALSFLKLTDNPDGSATLSGSPTAANDGQYVFTLTASNAIGKSTQIFTLTVGQAPSLPATGTATFTEAVKGSVTITATAGSPAKTALALAKGTTLPKGLSFKDNGNNTATISGTPATSTGGSYSFGITASNAAGLMATETFTLLIDQAPAITSPAGTTFTVGTTESFTVTTTGYPAAAFSENGPLPAGVSFVDNVDGTAAIIGTPSSAAAGVYPFTISATKGLLSATQHFKLTVDQPPIITSVASATFTVGTFLSFPITTMGFPTATLSENGTLPRGVNFMPGNGTATLSGTPSATDTAGTYKFTITASNGVLPESFQLFTLTVVDAKSSPPTGMDLLDAAAHDAATMAVLADSDDDTTSATAAVTVNSQSPAAAAGSEQLGVSAESAVQRARKTLFASVADWSSE